MIRTLTVLILLAAGGRSEVRGQEKPAWKFAPGEVFFVHREYVQKQEVEIKEKTFRQNNRSTWLDRFEVLKKDGDAWSLRWTLEDVVFRAEGPIGRGGPDKEMARKMKGATFVVTAAPSGKIVRLEGYPAFLKQVVGDKVELERVLRVVLSEAGLKAGLEEIFTCLPNAPIEKDQRWHRDAEEPLPPFGTFHNRLEYLAQPGKDGIITINCTIKTSYRPPDRPLDVLRVVKGTAEGDMAQARYRFDEKKGRLVEAERTMVLRGNLTVEIGEARSDLRFVSDNRLVIRVSDKADGAKAGTEP